MKLVYVEAVSAYFLMGGLGSSLFGEWQTILVLCITR